MNVDRPRLAVGLGASAGIAIAVAIVSRLTTPGAINLGPYAFAVREPWRPALVALVCSVASLWVSRAPRTGEGLASRVGRVLMTAGFAAGIASGVLVWAHYEVRYCGGVDSYGYVSAASAIASGTLVQPMPVVNWLPFPDGIMAAMPLGWTPTAARDAIVPGYPLGFPLVMAAAMRLAGPGAGFYVPLLAGLGVLWLTFRITRQFSDADTAAAATMIVAFNPVLLNMVIQPMSDVPAAGWYLAAFAGLALAPARPMLAGLAFGMAVWTRPLVVALAPALLIVMPRDRRTLLRFMAGGVPVAVAMAAFQWWLYGSPFRTGYGGTAGLFTTANIGRHLGAYVRWLLAAHAWLLPAALAVALWRAPRRLAVAACAGLVLGVVPYLFNLQFFDDFDVSRYLLPPLIPCLIVSVLGLSSLLHRFLAVRASGVVLLALAVAVSAGSYVFISGRAPVTLRLQESRYAAVAGWVAGHTPATATVLADLHSGALRYYAGRTTLRWVMLPKGALAATVDALARHGSPCYAAVDGDAEARSFEALMAASPHVLAEPLVRVRTAIVYRVSVTP